MLPDRPAQLLLGALACEASAGPQEDAAHLLSRRSPSRRTRLVNGPTRREATAGTSSSRGAFSKIASGSGLPSEYDVADLAFLHEKVGLTTVALKGLVRLGEREGRDPVLLPGRRALRKSA